VSSYFPRHPISFPRHPDHESHAVASSRRPSCSNAVPRRTKDLGFGAMPLRGYGISGHAKAWKTPEFVGYSSSRGVVCFPKYFQHVIAKIAM